MQPRKIRTLVTDTVVTALVVLAIGVLIVYVVDPTRFQSKPEVTFQQSPAKGPGASAPGSGAPAAATRSYAAAVAAAAPAVVNIYTTKVVTQRRSPLMDDPLFRRFFGGEASPRKRLENSLGSGVIMNPQGYILTNNHVVEGADEIRVALSDGRSSEATVVGTDPDTDLAVLKINFTHLPSVVIGPSERLRVGDVVLAIGNPFGVGQTVTMGIVSATGRSQLGISAFENFIQTDAAINPGNSGGALIDPDGRLIGVNTAIFTRSGGSQGIGFAIPSSLAKGVMKQIIEHGRVIRGWLGIQAQDITPALADSFSLDSTKGALVAGVLPGGPGDKAGLQSGDIITHVNQQRVNDARDVMITVSNMQPGSTAQLQIIRHGKQLQLQVHVGQRPRKRAES